MEEETTSDQNQTTPNFEDLNLNNSSNEISRGSNLSQLETLEETRTDIVRDKEIIFNNILSQINEDGENKWLEEITAKIYGRFPRMPNGWWMKIRQAFNTKFNHACTLPEIKSLYTRCKKGNHGTCSNGRDRRNSYDNLTRVVNSELYKKVKERLIINTEKFFRNLEPKYRTRKIYGPECNNEVLENINLVIQNENIQTSIDDLEKYSNILFACQVTYDEITAKPKKESNWKNNIMDKIQKFDRKISIIESYNQNDRPSKEMIKLCKENNIHSNDNEDIQMLKDSLFEKRAIYQKKIKISEKRIAFRKENKMFEFNRRTFYRNLEGETKEIDPNLSDQEIKSFWENIWTKEKELDNFDDLISTLEPIKVEIDMSDGKIAGLIEKNLRYISNWKTPGSDHIYNYFIKRIDVLHEKLKELIAKVINNPDELNENFYTGVTYLIPKKEKTTLAKETRPITCLSNIYKLISKCITSLVNELCESNEVISENQMGTIDKCQGAKEQALINKNLNKNYKNQLYTSWIDIQKAYDSVSHVYLLQCLKQLNFPSNIVQFVARTLEMQNTILMCNKRQICSVKMSKGIIQGDSLSPKLFVIAIEPLSRILNKHCGKINMTNDGRLERNHLIFVDDIKLLAETEAKLIDLCAKTKKCLQKMGFELNNEKCASNIASEHAFGNSLEGSEGYKYLGILENSNNVIKEENKIILKNKILSRIEKLCNTKLNARNLFHGINEYAISTINYHIGLIPFEPKEFEKIDDEIRKILYQYNIVKKTSNMDRLYLSRNNLGRGMQNLVEKSEIVLYKLICYLESNVKRIPIAEQERSDVTQLGLIKEYIKDKYEINDEHLNEREIRERQKEKRMKRIKEKKMHGILFENEEGTIDVIESSVWLKKGNISPQEEGTLCGVQDRNLFYQKQKCNHCNHGNKTVDHLATHCGRMLNFEYKKRHNDVVRCIHFMFTKKYGLNKNKKLKNYKVENVISNERVRIKSDVTIETELRIECNKPDLLIHDLKKNEITIIEVGITNKNILANVELNKARKYELLGRELSMMYNNAKVSLIPIVMTWDGLVTKYFKKYLKMLNIDKRLQAYMECLTIKRTCESILIDYKNTREEDDDNTIEEMMRRIGEQGGDNVYEEFNQ